jgi:uncharacterized protein (TIGR00369 family)
MQKLEPQDANFEAKVRASFARQGLMTNLGAQITVVRPGEVEIELASREDITQQHGFVHGAAVAAIVDTACGYAAISLLPEDFEVVTVEFKINFVSPALGKSIIARGRVKKAGKTLTVCEGDAFAIQDGKEKLVATMQATMMATRSS